MPIDLKGMFVKIVTKDDIKTQDWDDSQQVLPA